MKRTRYKIEPADTQRTDYGSLVAGADMRGDFIHVAFRPDGSVQLVGGGRMAADGMDRARLRERIGALVDVLYAHPELIDALLDQDRIAWNEQVPA